MNMKTRCILIATACTFLCGAFAGELEQGFVTPPDSARPQTWWHWMNGNVTKAGITADLEAMKRIGLGGAQIFSVPVGIPENLVPQVTYFSEDWRAMEQHAAEECARLGLELSALMGDGWSGGGGPWIKPDNAMQRVTWSETTVSGPTKFEGPLPQPETMLDTYRDIAVLAVPASPALPEAQKTVEGNTIQIAYNEPVTVRSLVLTKTRGGPGAERCELMVSDDGKSFRRVAGFDPAWGKSAKYPAVTFGFEPVTGKVFRVVLSQAGGTDVSLDAVARVSRWELKAGFEQISDHGVSAPVFAELCGNPEGKGVAPGEILDLTARMSADGRLAWDVPPGRWNILRIGFTPTGAVCAPATEAGRGLECDKLSARGIEAQFDAMMAKLLAQLGPLTGKTFTQAVIDSWEVHEQNWTAGFQNEFKKRRGYDMIPWLPVMAGGRIVGDRLQSDRFLWDLRRTIADLIAENFWGRLSSLCHEHGIIFQGEPCGRQQYLYDPIVFQKQADIPMGEFWVGPGARIDCRTAASAAHLYGKTVAAAEAYTKGKGNWEDDPYSMKALGDRAFSLGINRFVFHRYAHQPWLNLKPGMTMGPYGINLDRTNTWWEQGRAWMDYITRCQFLLQQGQFVADVVNLIGEGAPSALSWPADLHPPLPQGFDYDGCDAEAVLKLLSVQDGCLVTPSGMRYRFLLLPDTDLMTPEVARRVRDLVRDGALVIGPRPVRSPSLSGFPGCDDEVRGIGREVWGDCDGKTVKAHAFGKGRVYWGREFNELAGDIGLKPDFAFQSVGQLDLIYIHRQTKEADLYFVANQSDAGGDALCTFRVTGRQPELWDPATGAIRAAARYVEKDGCTTVQVPFDPRGSWFVVFRKPASPLAVPPDMAAHPPVPKIQSVPLVKKNPESNDFTVFFVAHPAVDIKLPAPSASPMQKDAGQNYALQPEQGERMFGPGHANMGVSVGKNGVTVWEHGARYFSPRITAAASLAGATEVAVVYRKGLPTLYINGKPAGTGETSPCTVHPGHPADFKGELRDLAMVPRALSAEEVAACFASTAPQRQDPLWIADGKVVTEKMTDPLPLDTGWEVAFPPDLGAPASVRLDRLADLSRHPEEGIRHFSGTATYSRTLTLTAAQLGRGKLCLDLGDVKNLAEVVVNGRNLGVLWKKPFCMDITSALKPGDNRIEIRITNLWVNRLIGDASKWAGAGIKYGERGLKSWPEWVSRDAPPPDAPVTFVTYPHWTADDQLLPSGLLGPVTLWTEVETARSGE